MSDFMLQITINSMIETPKVFCILVAWLAHPNRNTKMFLKNDPKSYVLHNFK